MDLVDFHDMQVEIINRDNEQCKMLSIISRPHFFTLLLLLPLIVVVIILGSDCCTNLDFQTHI